MTEPVNDPESFRNRKKDQPINPGFVDRFLNRLRKRFKNPTVNLLRLEGTLAPSLSRSGRGRLLNLERLADDIDRAFEGSRLQAVVLIINSPGGSPSQSQLIADRITRRAKEKRIPVLAFVEDIAASGGYWLALAADEIYALPMSVVGSIGVISSSFGFQGLIEKIGVERRVQTTGRYKDMLDPFRPQRQDERERLQMLLSDLAELFVEWVVDRRGDRLKVDRDHLTSGLVWTGREALKLGLIDGLADAEGLLRERFGEHVHLREVRRARITLAERLGIFGEALADSFVGAVESRMGDWHLK